MILPDFSDTIVALATPPGLGAIAVIRLSGPDAIGLGARIFKGKNLLKQASHTAHFGRLEAEDGRILDEVLVTLFQAPRSYTGENIVEISCHGSPYIQQEIIQLCVRQGARMAMAGEFTLRAFMNGKMDLSQAEAVADLIASQSEAGHDVAMRQLRGGFKNEISRLRGELIHFASMVELELDFSEEDVQFADRNALRALVQEIRRHTQALIASFQLGNVLKTGVTTVIAGRPNAGKSTLLNALLNEERAIVSAIAGTTRDTIEEVLNIHGVQFRLIDTAGIREAQDQIEAIGVQRTMEKIQDAAVLVYVWDITTMTLQEVYADLDKLIPALNTSGPEIPVEAPQGLLIVCNKMDHNPYFQTDWLLHPEAPEVHPYLLEEGTTGVPAPAFMAGLADAIIPISAKNQQNIEYFKEKLFEMVAGGGIRTDQTIVTNARHYAALRAADGALEDVLTGLDTGITGDFVAQDIRRALAFLGEITGEIGVEDLLGEIFGKFCIGK